MSDDPTATDAERARIAEVYSGARRLSRRDWYAWHREDVLFDVYGRNRCIAALLRRAELTDLSALDALDVGCGFGGLLATLLTWGARAERLHGVDLQEARIEQARSRLPAAVDLRAVNALALPYGDASFDLVTAFTVFSSIVDASLSARLAAELRRVCRPDGRILIYDMTISDPTNDDTIAVRLRHVRQWFSGAAIDSRSVTLAPPLGRLVFRFSPGLGALLEWALPLLRTHRMYSITPAARAGSGGSP